MSLEKLEAADRDADERAARSAAIGVGMVIAAAIIVRVWGEEVEAAEILGAAGLTTVAELRAIGAEAYDVWPLRGVLRTFRQRDERRAAA